MKSFRLTKILALTSMFGLAISGCAGSEGDTSSTDQELTSVNVGVIPVVDVAPVYLGIEEGIFEQHGLEVTPTVAQGGAAIIPGVESGDFDFGFSNVTSLILGSAQGLPLKIVAPGPQTTGKINDDYASIMVAQDSNIASVNDLAGKRVAVNTLNNITDTLLKEAMHQAGGDPDSIELVEVAYPEMPGMLENGNVDAIFVAEPFQTIAGETGAHSVYSPFVQPVEDLMISTYFTTEKTLQDAPEVVEQFTAAIKEAQEFAEQHPEKTRAVLDDYLELEPSVVEELVLPKFPQDINQDSTQQLIDLAVTYDLIPEPVDLNSLLAE